MACAASPQLVRWLSLCWLLAPAVALAHVGQGDVGGGLVAGIEHPIFGLDHVIAMVAVGMWGAQLGPPAIWVLPVTFPLVMAFGGVLGAIGVPIPGIEIGIAISAVVLGGMVAFAARPPLWVAASTGRDLRDLSRLRARRGVAGIGQRHRLLGRLRSRYRLAPRARHPHRRDPSLAGRSAGAARRRRSRGAGGRLFPGQGSCRLTRRSSASGAARRPRPLRLWLVLLAPALTPTPASRESAISTPASCIPLTALENVLPFLALGILCGQQGQRAQVALPLFWIALMAGATAALWLPGLAGADLINILSALILGA